MGVESAISWTHASFNPIRSCVEISPACDHCYARELAKRNPKVLGVWGSESSGGTRVVAAEKYWKEPIKWNKQAAADGVRKRVFCESLGDVFEDWQGKMVSHNGHPLHRGDSWRVNSQWIEVPDLHIGKSLLAMSDVRQRLFQLIDATPWLDWLLLTKRPKNIQCMWPEIFTHSCGATNPNRIAAGAANYECNCGEVVNRWYRSNVWIGTTVENQEYANKRIPELLKCRWLSPVLWLSCEPLLGPVNLSVPWSGEKELPTLQADWVIGGGESGPHARPSHPDWFRSLRDQCDEADVPYHHKQNGEWVSVSEVAGDGRHFQFEDGATVRRIGTKASGRLLDGVLHDAFPVAEDN